MGFVRYFGLVADRDNGNGVAGVRVEAWDVEDVFSDAVAITKADADGKFSFSLTRTDVDRLFAGRKPIVRFKVISGAMLLADTRGSHTWHLREHARGRIDVNPSLPIGVASLSRLVVRGTLMDANTGAMSGVTVKAFDRNVGSSGVNETLIGEDTTDARGRYQIAFDNGALGRIGKPVPDLVVRAVEDSNVLAEGYACAALPITEVALIVGGEVFHGRGEHVWLRERLQGLRGEVAWSALSTDQAEFLACSGRVDRLSVDALIAAAQLATDVPEVPEEAFFGLLRHGLPSSRVMLLSHRPGHLRKTLAKAIAAGSVSHALESQLDDIQQALEDAAVLSAFEARPNGVGLGTLIACTPEVSSADQQSFVRKLLRHTGSTELFWSAINADNDLSIHANAFQFTVEIAPLVANHTAMIDALHAQRTANELQDPADLARLLVLDWETLVNTTNVPPDTPGATAAQKKANYVAWLDRTAEARFRTTRIADRIGRAAPTADITTFFTDNHGFRFESTRVAKYLAEQPGALGNVPENNRASVTAHLTKLERLVRVTNTYEELAALDSAGLTSAYAIHRKGKRRFLADHAAALGGEVAAANIFVKASWAVSAGTALLGKYASSLQSSAAVLPDGKTLPGSLPTQVADWSTLFGSVDSCACEHCQSVLSSSAYLVDLLQFLERQPVGSATGRDRLFAKRPDIEHLELSCKTSETPLPHIDLVNEVMAVALLHGETPPMAWPTSIAKTTGTPEELLAAPELLYSNWHLSANNLLANAVHPFDVPFHLWNEEARVYLQHLGVPRWELLETLDPTGEPDPFSAALVAERLGVSTRQRAIIAGEALPSVTLAKLWGYSANSLTFPGAFSNVQVFLRKAGLSYEELLELIATGLYTSMAIPENAGCDLATMTWGVPSTADLTQAHRFLRLRRALGWSITDLGKAVTAFGEINSASLAKITTTEALRQKLGADVPTLLSFFADIDRNGSIAPSLYERLFLMRTVAHPEDKPFRDILAHATGSPTPAGSLVDHKEAILVAVGGSAIDLDLVIDADAAGSRLALLPAISESPSAADLNLANLSRLYRIFALARSLHLSVAELRVLSALSGIPALLGDPAAGASPANTLDFLDVSERVRQSRFPIAEIHYFVRHVAGPKDTFVPSEEQIEQLLSDLAATVARASTDTPKAIDPKGSQVEPLLRALLSEQSAVDSLLAVLDGTSALNRSARLDLAGTYLHALVLDIGDAQHRLVGLIDDDPEYLPTRAERYDYLELRLLHHTNAAAAVRQTLGATFGLPAPIIERLVSTLVLPSVGVIGCGAIVDFLHDVEPGNPAVTAATRRAHLLRIHKVSLLVKRLRISSEELLVLFPADGAVSPGGLPWVDLHALPVTAPPDLTALDNAKAVFGQLLRFMDVAALRDRWPTGSGGLFELFRLALTAELGDVEKALARQTSLRLEDVGDLRERFVLTAESFRSEGSVLRLDRAIAVLRKLGVSASDAIAWTDLDVVLPTPDPGGTPGVSAIARNIQRAARAKYSAEAWTSVARPLRDVVRERERSALVAYLAAKRGYDRPGKLYEDLLIDVEMSPCMLTSRTVQAVAAVQLFVQRALLRMEGTFTLDEDAAREWEWLKSYRVWEANRKVFLYPENWIEPELRDDKTPLFRDFENRLSQGPLTGESADRAFQGYLEGLHEIAHLDVIAIAEEVETNPDDEVVAYVSAPRRVLHIFGRTSPPHVYYYRRYQEGSFSPWEKIDLDLPEGHLVPVVHNRRLHLFWPEVLEKSPGNAGGMQIRRNDDVVVKFDDQGNPEPDASALDFSTDATEETPPKAASEELPPKRLFLTLAYSEYKSGRWIKKRLAKEAAVQIPIDIPPNEPTPPRFLDPVFFLGRSSGTSITIDACLSDEGGAPSTYTRFARFAFDPCAARSTRPEGFDSGELALPENTVPLRQAFTGEGSLELVKDENRHHYSIETVFAQTPTPYTLVVARSKEPTTVRNAVFFKDDNRTLFLERRTERVEETLSVSKVWTIQGLNGAVIHTEETTAIHVFESTGFRAHLFYHPYACSFLRRLAQHGVDGLLRWAGKEPRLQLTHADISNDYGPNVGAIETPLPVEDIDFSAGGAYSAYNWEVFFHAPLLVAIRLDGEQRFQEADRWYRYIFDPTDGSNEDAPARFWKVRPFYENKNLGDLLTELTTLAADDYNMHLWELSGLANGKPRTAASEGFAAQIATWRKDPFSPHAIARLRPVTYQKYVVMRYIDHLLSWGDQLFRMDTRESVAEATQLYVYASQLLGARPTILAKAHPPEPKTYGDLVAIDAFSNALVNIEAISPPHPVWGAGYGQAAPPETVWGTLYFCLPPNDKLLRYWDIVEDRLFKLRCCMSIDGVRRDLPLFEAPIDPALLVRAKAAGVDIASVLADLNAGAPVYRFTILHARAVEYAGYVSSLGAGLLSALEKRDAEQLSTLRNTHEIRLAQTMRQVKKRQIDEAKEQLTALERGRAVVEERKRFYTEIPKRLAPENEQLTKIDIATALHVAAETASVAAASTALLPDTSTGTAGPFPVGVSMLGGGITAARVATLVIGGLHAGSYIHSQEATKLGIEAGYQRRDAEWRLQTTLAERELAQIDKQIAAARIRVAITEGDLQTHEQAIEQAREVEAFFRDKFTNEELYDWMIRQSSTLHDQAYRLAYQMARRAEKAYQYERGDDNDTFIRFDAWDGARSGLLAGERLLLDLRRLEAAYLERNKREYEISKHVSLAAHAPRELLRLREVGEASIRIAEEHFDQDFPTHYLRRLKAVSLSVPCVTGPYQGVHAKLTLLGGETRRSVAGNDIAVSRGAIQSIVTSSGQNDGGQFELIFRDDRYLPFEGVGAHVGAAASPQWDLKLSKSTNRFRFDSISDAILHVRYTARDGRINDAPTPFVGACLFSAKADFPDAWRAFQDSESQLLAVPFTTALFSRPEAMPVVKLKRVSFYTKRADGQSVAPTMTVTAPSAISLSLGVGYGQLVCHEETNSNLAPATWQLSVAGSGLTHADLADIWIAVDYQATSA